MAFFVRSISYCAQVCVRNAAECRAFVYRRAIRECELTYADGPKKFVILGDRVSVTEYSSVHLSNIVWGTGTESFDIAFIFWVVTSKLSFWPGVKSGKIQSQESK